MLLAIKQVALNRGNLGKERKFCPETRRFFTGFAALCCTADQGAIQSEMVGNKKYCTCFIFSKLI